MKRWLRSKSASQVFSFCLLVACVGIMTLCAVARLCGILWFTANMDLVKLPSELMQEIIVGALMMVELVFVLKILCRKAWVICLAIAFCETFLGIVVGIVFKNNGITSAYYLICYITLPIFLIKHITVKGILFRLLETMLLYTCQLVYGILFLVGRIGGVGADDVYNFANNVLGTIDYKLFIVTLYLVIKNFGGIKLWKRQKQLTWAIDQ